jgi:hypothetical protein
MREGYLSSRTGVVDALPDGGTEGARRATGVTPGFEPSGPGKT